MKVGQGGKQLSNSIALTPRGHSNFGAPVTGHEPRDQHRPWPRARHRCLRLPIAHSRGETRQRRLRLWSSYPRTAPARPTPVSTATSLCQRRSRLGQGEVATMLGLGRSCLRRAPNSSAVARPTSVAGFVSIGKISACKSGLCTGPKSVISEAVLPEY